MEVAVSKRCGEDEADRLRKKVSFMCDEDEDLKKIGQRTPTLSAENKIALYKQRPDLDLSDNMPRLIRDFTEINFDEVKENDNDTSWLVKAHDTYHDRTYEHRITVRVTILAAESWFPWSTSKGPCICIWMDGCVLKVGETSPLSHGIATNGSERYLTWHSWQSEEQSPDLEKNHVSYSFSLMQKGFNGRMLLKVNNYWSDAGTSP
jgi:hypothetical protein